VSPDSSSPATADRDRFLGVLSFLCAGNFAVLAPRLRSADLNLDYPFMDGDSWDWIANGLRLFGHDVRYSGRPPLLPFILGLLDRLSALSWFPVLNLLVFHLAVVLFYLLAARLFPRRAAFAVALALLFDSSLQSLALEVMADLLAAALLLLALLLFDRAGERPREYLLCGLAAGASVLAQQAALLAVLPAAIAVAALRRRHLRSPWLWSGALGLLALQGLWLGYRRIAFGTYGDLLLRYSTLVRPHLGAVPTYLFAFASLLGLPACVVLAAGLAPAARRAFGSATLLLSLLLFASVLTFFVFFYDFNAKRFLLYALWPAGLCIAAALSRLTRRTTFGAAAILMVAGAALPLPSPGHDGSWAGLWPLPPILVHAGTRTAATGSATVEPATLRIETFSAAALWGFGKYARVWKAAASRQPATAFDPTPFRADRAALFLYDDAAGDRYRTVTRLGNALRKRVRFVPLTYLEPYAGWIAAAPLGTVRSDYNLWRVRLPRLAESWLLAVPAGRPFSAAAASQVSGAVGADDSGGALALGLLKAEAIHDFLAGSDAYVALLARDGIPGADLSPLYLPFLLDSTELYVFGERQSAAVRAFLAPAPVLAERRFGSTVVRRLRLYGRASGAIEYR